MHTISETAARLRCSDRTIQRLFDRGLLERVKVGRLTFVADESLTTYLAARGVTA